MSGSKNSLKVRVDISRNRLYCVIAGKITGKDIDEFYTDIRFGVADLKSGFDVVTDLTQCQFSHLAAIPTFRKIMHYLADKGAREVVRVVNRDSMVFRQAMNITAHFQGYKPIYVDSITAADELLDKSNARSGLRFHLLKTEAVYETEILSSVGKILDISVTGCSFLTQTDIPAVGQKLRVKIALTAPKSTDRIFELDAKVVRLITDGFAVAFAELEDTTKKQLLDCLVHELKRDVCGWPRISEKNGAIHDK